MTNTEQIQNMINKYVQSVNDLDLEKARSLWADAPGISFIHPRGHETGLEQIIRLFYQETMGKFSKRELLPYDLNITVIDDTAVVVFYWNFYAVFAHDSAPLETHGRETQVMVKNDNEWKLLHIHYSSLPVKGEREGF